MSDTVLLPQRRRLTTAATWLSVGACLAYAAFALAAAATETLSQLGLVDDAPARSAPLLFIAHALTGGTALIAGPLQLALARRTLARAPRLHRALGRAYVGAAWITSAGGLGTAVAFDVGPAGTLAFAIWSLLWFGTTTAALIHIRRGRVWAHREWMVRSIALALVFAAFSFVQPALAGAGLPRDVAYPLSVLACLAVTLAAAEFWLRRAHPTATPRSRHAFARAAVPGRGDEALGCRGGS